MTDVVPMMDADGQHLESDEELRSLFAAIDDYLARRSRKNVAATLRVTSRMLPNAS